MNSVSRPRIKKRNSRRKLGARSYKNYSQEMLNLATELVSSKKISSREAENQFGIPRKTILNKCRGIHNKNVGSPTKLTPVEEQKIVKVLIAAADFGSPLTRLDLRQVVYDYLKKNCRENVFNGKPPGEVWVKNFLTRHAENLTVRSTQNIKRVRSEKGVEEMKEYFANLQANLQGVPPSNILNIDETNVTDDPGASKCIFKRGTKYPERIVNSTKGTISLMFAISADGKSLPPYTVYKSDSIGNTWTEWCLGGPSKARYNTTNSGWFDSKMFEDYFQTIVVEWAKELNGTKIVICDNLSSHLNVSVQEECDKHNIRLIFLPPNSTHLTQPLDVAFFAPLKREWRKILLEYKFENPNQSSLNKKHFPALLKKLMLNVELNSKRNILSGFRTTGIYPLNPQNVLKKLPEYQDEITSYQVDEAFLKYLKETRQPKPLPIKRNKKVKIAPGTSVTALDVLNIINKPETKVNNPNNRSKRRIKNRTKINNNEIVLLENGRTEILDEEAHILENIGEVILNERTGAFATDVVEILDGCTENVEEVILNEETGNFESNLAEIHNEDRNKIHSDREEMLTTGTDMSEQYREDLNGETVVLVEDKKLIKRTGVLNLIIEDKNLETNKSDFKTTLTSKFSKNKIDNKRSNKIQVLSDITLKQPHFVKHEIPTSSSLSNNEPIWISTRISKKNIRTNIVDSDTDTDISENLSLNDSTDTEISIESQDHNYKSESETEVSNENEREIDDLEIGMYVLVKFETNKRNKYYVGKILEVEGTNITVRYLRKKTNGTFVWPQIEDKSVVFKWDVIRKMPNPINIRRGLLKFKINLNNYKIE